MAYSPKASLFASVVPTGHLRVWNVTSGEIRVQKTPDLAEPISCIQWEPCQDAPAKPKNKRKKRSAAPEATDATQLLIGLKSGTVSLLNLVSGETTILDDSHDGAVNSACWGTDGNAMYTCSDDKYIFQWDVKSKSVETKWIADKRCVSAVSLGPLIDNVQTLLSAGSQIKLWNLATKEQMKKFPGHQNPVQMLALTPTEGFVSCVFGHPEETLLNVWSPTKSKQPVAACEIPDALVNIDINHAMISKTKWRTLVVSTTGQVYIFDVKEGEDKTVSHTSTIGIKSGESATKSIPILSAAFDKTTEGQLHISYGLVSAPTFETVTYIDEDSKEPTDITLTREAPINALDTNSKSQKKSKGKANGEQPTVIGIADVHKSKRKKTTTGSGDITLAEQVNSLHVTPVATKSSGQTPQAGSLAQMLVQALHSNDEALLEECLNYNREKIVRQTVKRLPPTYVVKFLQLVVYRFQSRPGRAGPLLVWVRAVLTIHTAHLSTVPNLPSALGGLYGIVEARLAVFPQILKLSGRLDLMLSQISAKGQNDQADDDLLVPISKYQEQDTDDEDDEDEYDDDEDDDVGGNADDYETEDDDDDDDDNDDDDSGDEE